MKWWQLRGPVETVSLFDAALELAGRGYLEEAVWLCDLEEEYEAVIGKYERIHRLHYRPIVGREPICGTRGKKIRVTGVESVVTCGACLRSIRKRKRDGVVDLLGNAA